MSAGIRAIREGLATAIATAGVTAYDTLPASPIPPFAVVMYPDRITFGRTLGGLHEYDIDVDVYVSLSDVEAGQKALDGYIDGGIKAAIETHTPAPWRNVQVVDVVNVRAETLDNVSCLAATFTITAIG